MYLRGVQYSEMESIMQFIYLGEATFYEERMNEFLAVAKSLEIKELCNAETEDELNYGPSSCGPETQTENLEEPTEFNQIIVQAPEKRQRRVVGVESTVDRRQESTKYACNQCDYQATHPSNLNRHIQSKHEGIKYACDQCDYQATRQDHLRTHIKKKHSSTYDQRHKLENLNIKKEKAYSLTERIEAKL